MEKKFESIQELINDPYFVKSVTNSISEFRSQRHNLKEPEPGFRYKRIWYDRMTEQGQLSCNYFLSNIESIWAKKSTLPSEVRNVIQYVCDKAAKETALEYSKKELIIK